MSTSVFVQEKNMLRNLIRTLFALVFITSLVLASFGSLLVAQDATAEPTEDVVEIETGGEGEMAELSGDIVISFQGNDTQTWEALCAAYTEIHPNVNCRVELKPSEGYQEFIRAQFAAGEPTFSLTLTRTAPTRVNRGERTSRRPRWATCVTR
jgi:ABC-type glycerol-3-phosphate transport system substrate-binding protein